MSRALPQSEDLHGTRLVLIMASIGMTVIAYNTTAVITICRTSRPSSICGRPRCNG